MERPTEALVLLILILGVALLYWPALDLGFVGDDYQWLQHAHHARHDPRLLLADLDTFYRPASTWTLVLDRLAWGAGPRGHHLTNLVLHAVAGCLLFVAGRRLGLKTTAAAGATLVWMLAPFADEPALSVAIRFQSLLLISWLMMVILWPRGPDESWSRVRLAGVCATVALALFSKESWVVTPLLVIALDRAQRRVGWSRALSSAAPVTLAAALYTALYFAVYPSDKEYFRWAPETLLKVPHELAAFLYLEGLKPLQFPASWRSLLAVAIVVFAVWICIRQRLGAGAVGAALIVAAALPTLMVPYLPTRHTTIPYAGFVLLAAACCQFGVASLGRRLGLAAAGALAVVVALVAVAGWYTVRADIEDFARVSAAHERLLGEARGVVDRFSVDRPVVVVRMENEAPLADVARNPRGLPKLWFPRPRDPYGLIDAAALFELAMARDGIVVEHFAGGTAAGDILVHRSAGFEWLDRPTVDVVAAAATYRSSGFSVRVIVARSLG